MNIQPDFISNFIQLDQELHQKQDEAPVSSAQQTLASLNDRIVAINQQSRDLVSNLDAHTPVALPSATDADVAKLEKMGSIKNEVEILNKEMRQKVRDATEGFFPKLGLWLKIIFSLGFYTSYAPQIDPKPLTQAVSKCVENFKLLKITKELPAADHSDFAPPALTSTIKSFYPWKNTRNNDYMISVVDASGQKDYKCSFNQLTDGKIVLEGGSKYPDVELEIQLPIASSKDLETKLYSALAANKDVKARPYGQVQEETELKKFVVTYDSARARQELNGLKGKLPGKDIVVITKDTKTGGFDLLTLKKDGNISQEKFSVDVNGRVSLGTQNKKSMGEFKDSINNVNSIFIDEASKLSKLDEAQKAAMREQTGIISGGALKVGLLKPAETANKLKEDLAKRLKVMSPQEAGAFIYQTGTGFKMVCGNEQKAVVEYDISIQPDGGVQYKNINFPKNSDIETILNLRENQFKKVEEAQTAYEAMKPKASVAVDPMQAVRENTAYYKDSNSAKELLTKFGGFFENKTYVAGTWAMTTNESKSKIGRFVGWVAGDTSAANTFTIWAHNGNTDPAKTTIEEYKVTIDPNNKEKPYELLSVHYSSPEEIVKAKLPFAKEIKPFTSLEAEIKEVFTFETQIEFLPNFIPRGDYSDLITRLAQVPANKNRYVIQHGSRDDMYRVIVFGPKDGQQDEKVFFTRNQGSDPKVPNARVWDSDGKGYPVVAGIIADMRGPTAYIAPLDVTDAVRAEQASQQKDVRMPGAPVEPKKPRILGSDFVDDLPEFIAKPQLEAMLQTKPKNTYCITWDASEGVQLCEFDAQGVMTVKTAKLTPNKEGVVLEDNLRAVIFDTFPLLLADWEASCKAKGIKAGSNAAPGTSPLSAARLAQFKSHPAFVDAQELVDSNQFLKGKEAYALTVGKNGPAFVHWTGGERYTHLATERDGKFVIKNVTAPTLDAVVPIMTQNKSQPAKVLLAQQPAANTAVQTPILQPKEKPQTVFQNVMAPPQPQSKPAAVEPAKQSVARAPAPTSNKQGSPEVVAKMEQLTKTFMNPKNNNIPYNLGSKAYLAAVKDLWIQLDTWKSAKTALTSQQANQALGLILNNPKFGDIYRNIDDVTSLRTADIPTPPKGGKTARDELLTWLWQQK